MQRIISETKRKFACPGLEDDPETYKSCMIDVLKDNTKTVKEYFDLLPQICEHCRYKAEPGDIQDLVEYSNMDKIGEAILYVRKNTTAYTDVNIISCVFNLCMHSEIEYIYLSYFTHFTKDTWKEILKHKQYQPKGIIVLLLYCMIDFNDLSLFMKVRIMKQMKSKKMM